ncbi:MAG: HAMP domain-containing sensor histidine kinase [Amphritea sp.]
MRVKWYKSLFWKIFLSIWLSSFIVVAATAFVVGQLAEKEKYRDVLAARALGHADRIVDRYERFGRVIRPQDSQAFRRSREHDGQDHGHDEHRGRRMFPLPKLTIIDQETGKLIFSRADAQQRGFKNPINLELESDSGKRYKVVVEADPRRSPYGHLFRFLLSVQAVLIIAVSAMASLLLTWIIIRPINRLRQHTQDLYNGDLGARTDDRLARRGDEIGELSREFNRMADFVEQTLQSNQRLLQDVSHELRAPLARLQMAAGLAEQRIDEQDHEVIARINLECERINRLIDEILSLSRLEKMDVSGLPFEVSELLESLVADCRFSAPEHKIIWDQAACRCQVSGNAELLARAVSNILGNALKHTVAGTEITVQLMPGPKHCQIIISDNGKGVDAQQLEQLFKPFYRVSTEHQGYGLGLSIAKRAVELLGGSINASSTPGKGLSVVIVLPRPS